ncbi:serine/threonine-protein kinase pim-2-like [Centropristis striata]|uniref:serine/threonine-protein kinase pim-2-like n=1 Tax=Centropristis striata TaxID=184440 RepID=UPI0027DFD54B|nr:serine/threonine-protein kinase pim-2-like [Centropristis striata]
MIIHSHSHIISRETHNFLILAVKYFLLSNICTERLQSNMDEKTLYSLDSENGSKSSGSTTEPNYCMGMRRNKRKASMNYSLPRKRQRCADEPPEVPVETATARETNEKAPTAEQSWGKKQRGHKNNSGQGTKRKASTERGPSPKRRRTGTHDTNAGEPTKVSAQEVSPSSCRPSTSRQNNGTPSCSVRTSREKFEAKYLLLLKLGEGRQGTVYAGERKTDNLPVAIKRIPKAAVKTRPVVINGKTQMLPLEGLLMLRVAGGARSLGKHAAVSLLDWYDLGSEVLLVMERPVPCEDLLTYLNKNLFLREDRAKKNIMKQLVEAAIKMHSRGVFHRDIKAENVLVDLSSDVPRVRIVDFGSACLVTKIPRKSFSGTTAYIPPEFFRRGTYEAGPSTVWQLGALLYEMVDSYFTTKKFLRKKITINTMLSKDCQDLLKVCLAVNPQERGTLEQILLHPWFS